MSSSTSVADDTLPRVHAEAEGLSDDPIFEAVQVARRREEPLLAAELRSQVQPRGRVTQAKQHLVEAMVSQLGVQKEYDYWLQARHDLQALQSDTQAADTSAAVAPEYVSGPQKPFTRSVGEMWWGESTVFLPGLPGMQAAFESDALHLRDQISWRDGDLWQGNLLITSKFGLDPARMPPGGPGRFVSTPNCDVTRRIAGDTGWWWGDNWSKCWMHLAQIVLDGPTGNVIAEGHDHRNLFHLSQDGELGFFQFPGFLPFPRVEFQLNPSRVLIIKVELRLDFQMEGSSHIYFGSQTIGQPPQRVDVLYKGFQWFIRRL
ncbi:hypothetical protein [Streptosporangium sp. NPDC049376]|uniref:hypothetical protein n=1 Tax=Streptosporangium sp. NPDC049376 TaxID=3366192 RepID=UPI0037AC025F